MKNLIIVFMSFILMLNISCERKSGRLGESPNAPKTNINTISHPDLLINHILISIVDTSASGNTVITWNYEIGRYEKYILPFVYTSNMSIGDTINTHTIIERLNNR